MYVRVYLFGWVLRCTQLRSIRDWLLQVSWQLSVQRTFCQAPHRLPCSGVPERHAEECVPARGR